MKQASIAEHAENGCPQCQAMADSEVPDFDLTRRADHPWPVRASDSCRALNHDNVEGQ